MTEQPELTDEQRMSLLGRGDCSWHFHQSDRSPTHETINSLWGLQSVSAKTANYTLTQTDDIIEVDSTSGNITVTLPKSAGGKVYTIIKTVEANNVIIDGNGSETIDGATTQTLYNMWTSVTIKAVSGNWVVVSSHLWNKATYGAISRTTDLTATAANTPTLITFDTTDYISGMTNNTSDGIHVTATGIYNYQYSLQFANTDNANHEAIVWLKKNGSNVAGTGTKFTVVSRKSVGNDGYTCGAVNFFVQLAAGDYLELWWAADAVKTATPTDGVYIEAYASSGAPYSRPSIPSAVATVTFVSAL